ncbi:MAG: site-2 protease family protein, partial [Bacteroidales bacterium]|nr:site-2 protease family protein [Bacteroidales bacterium]
MESFLIKAAQLILAFAFLVIIHEFGHLLMARAFGIKVEKYYIFFNPWFSLFKWKPKPPKKPKLDSNGNPRPTWRDTEYGIGWVPLGGYVKIAGMIDESMDTEQMAQPEQPWEFRAKPAYQRLLVMLGGVIFNFILAIIIYAGIAWHWGTKYIPFDNAYEGMDFVPSAQAIGFRNGDIPLLADGQKIDASQNDYAIKMVEAKTVSVLRNHRDTVDIAIPSDFIFRLNDDKGFMSYRMPVVVSATQGGTAASEAGLQKLDRIIAVDTISTPSFTEFAPTLAQYGGKPTTITIIRDGQEMKLPVTPSEGGKLGIMLAPITEI